MTARPRHSSGHPRNQRRLPVSARLLLACHLLACHLLACHLLACHLLACATV
ncbi:hypothetical protein [Streptomyces uncialis]|uniref:hypothetical protein n=1 Tax=Streptomyces uncialis TaxID=1048205 RepID=UPI0038697D41|nr:hypothetical protein OG924_22170 [Streptomyces uncialis]